MSITLSVCNIIFVISFTNHFRLNHYEIQQTYSGTCQPQP